MAVLFIKYTDFGKLTSKKVGLSYWLTLKETYQKVCHVTKMRHCTSVSQHTFFTHEMQYLYLLARWAVLSCNSNMGMITSKLLEEIVGALYHRNNLTEWSCLPRRYEKAQDYKKRNSLAFWNTYPVKLSFGLYLIQAKDSSPCRAQNDTWELSFWTERSEAKNL